MQNPSSSYQIPPEEAGGILTVDLTALVGNWSKLRERVRARGAVCSAVIKADAYGVGLEPVLTALAKAGCNVFFVAHVSEGKRARAIDEQAVIYVLNGLLPGTASIMAQHRLRPVLGSLEEIEEWSAFCRSASTRLPAAVHIDTGMNRLGLPIKEALTFDPKVIFKDFEPALVMSHLTSAEEADHPDTIRQIEAFRAVRAAFPDIRTSLANSSGIFLQQAPFFDLVRPGYALYGGNPTPDKPNPMQPVIELSGTILQVRTVEPGTSVGYNGRWIANGPCRLATVSIGYADGYPRSASGTDKKRTEKIITGEAIVSGRLCPIVGTISMDLVILDITGVSEHLALRGSKAVLIGESLDIDEVAQRAGTIGYEILTNLGHRYARRYLNGSF